MVNMGGVTVNRDGLDGWCIGEYGWCNSKYGWERYIV